MVSSLTSTSTLTNALRNSILEIQTQLSKTQVEISSGRVADLGLSLGGAVGQDYNLAIHRADLASITQTNSTVSARLDTTQTALGSLASTAQSFLQTLVGALSNGSDAATIQSQAANDLKSLIAALNTTSTQEYIFAGINTGVAPIVDYFSNPPSANKLAVDQAFFTAFGFSQSGAGVNSISASQMQTFLSGAFSNLFSSPNWTSDWSTASSQTIQSRISLSQIIDTSVSANDPALQQLAIAYTMVADLGTANLSDPAYKTVLQTATQTMEQAVSGLTSLRASVGIMQQSVTNANQSMTLQQSAITLQMGSLENVDPYEASTRLNNLMTQIETSYVLTGKIQQLTLSKYI
jgi:flagellar hook-associated protein 3 FlgL